jgi:hypothetical protein
MCSRAAAVASSVAPSDEREVGMPDTKQRPACDVQSNFGAACRASSLMRIDESDLHDITNLMLRCSGITRRSRGVMPPPATHGRLVVATQRGEQATREALVTRIAGPGC